MVWSKPTQLAVVRTENAGSAPAGPPSVRPMGMVEVPANLRFSICQRAMFAAMTRSVFSRIVRRPVMRSVIVAVETTTKTSIATITSTMVKPPSPGAGCRAGRRDRLSLLMAHPTNTIDPPDRRHDPALAWSFGPITPGLSPRPRQS